MTHRLPPNERIPLRGGGSLTRHALDLIVSGLCPVDRARLVPDPPGEGLGVAICPVCAMGYWARTSHHAGRRTLEVGCVQTYKQV